MRQTALYRLRFGDEGHHRLADRASMARSPRSLAIGLGSWHFSRFAFLVLVVVLGARLLAASGDQRAGRSRPPWAAGGSRGQPQR